MHGELHHTEHLVPVERKWCGRNINREVSHGPQEKIPVILQCVSIEGKQLKTKAD
jgi:hypothetical protein